MRRLWPNLGIDKRQAKSEQGTRETERENQRPERERVCASLPGEGAISWKWGGVGQVTGETKREIEVDLSGSDARRGLGSLFCVLFCTVLYSTVDE